MAHDFRVEDEVLALLRGYEAMPPTASASVAGSSDANWPAELEPEAFHGLSGEWVRLVEPHTEADPAALLVQLLVHRPDSPL
jgi:hypothetical protein